MQDGIAVLVTDILSATDVIIDAWGLTGLAIVHGVAELFAIAKEAIITR